MNGWIGQAATLIGLGVAAFGSILGFIAGRRGSVRGLVLAERCAYVFGFGMLVANLAMVAALLSHDFSVSYVAQVGSRATPPLITVVSLWSSLEGSILFWGLILGIYTVAFTWFNRHRQRDLMPYALGTILAICAFFAFLIAGPANPFLPVSPVPPDGPGPNPLLQNHYLMIIHPPMLYFGYVGMTIPFGIAVAALLKGQLNEGWLKVLRRWTMTPWMFLSVGIILGSWWAYEVLGWGGYWAWDPVENASFLPWLAATGYLHSTVVQERKRILKAWTLSLVLGAFMLTILGTFMTRSGVFNSVHSFTQSAIGPVFLVFLGIVLLLSVVLLGGRGHLLENEGRIEAVLSRETAFLVNNILFVVFTFTVLLGTVFPLVTEAVKGVKVSVGEPYFDKMAVPIGMFMVFLMGVGPVLPWGRPRLESLLRDFLAPLLAGLVAVVGCLAFGLREPMPLATFGLCGFAAFVTLRELVAPAWYRSRSRSESFVHALGRTLQGSRRRAGGYVVHLGVIVIVAAIAGSG
ncbi:MAG TPA: cytochrome c biogenesis protein CcsA, partial [Myxococcota bacterium]|nr:cytochrome c biogenesis protein CcsA [Myxococcota bacterium]